MVPVDRTSAHLVGGEESSKRRQILDGACKVFLDLGFDGASMGAIARAAGVSKGTLYVYFADKCRLLEAIVEGARKASASVLFRSRMRHQDDITEVRRGLYRHTLPAAWRISSPHGLRDRRAYAGNWPRLLRTCGAENR